MNMNYIHSKTNRFRSEIEDTWVSTLQMAGNNLENRWRLPAASNHDRNQGEPTSEPPNPTLKPLKAILQTQTIEVLVH